MLRQIMLNKQRAEIQAQIAAADAVLLELEEREAKLMQAIADVKTEEERIAVEEQIEAFEADKAEAQANKETLDGKLAKIDEELNKYEDEPTEPKPGGEGRSKIMTRSILITRGFFQGWEEREAVAFVRQEEVQSFLAHCRELGSEQRKVTGAELLIPITLIGMLRDNINRYSKLMKYVWVRPLGGKARINVAGPIPEGVWTEACAKLNELSLSFNQYELDGYKVGGFVAICKATLEDSDLNLANEILDNISQAIGYAVDKAIIYGTGKKMPVGIVTRLAQAAKPENWGANAPAWKDLHTTHIQQVVGATAEALFADLIVKTGVAEYAYGTGGKFWAMNHKTKMLLMSKLVTFNASGAIVANLDNAMPIIGGAIEELPFIPDGDIIGGFGSQYILVERAGMSLDTNDRLQWIEENILFKGTARYDGSPLNGEGFVALNISGAAPATTVTFAADAANPAG